MSARTFQVGDRVKAAAHVAREMVGGPYESQYHHWQAARGTVVRLIHDVWPATAFAAMNDEEKAKAYAEGRWVRIAWDREKASLARDQMDGVPYLKSDLFLT